MSRLVPWTAGAAAIVAACAAYKHSPCISITLFIIGMSVCLASRTAQQPPRRWDYQDDWDDDSYIIGDEDEGPFADMCMEDEL